MEHQGQHGYATTTGVDGYGNPVAGHGVAGHGAAGGQFQPTAGEEHRSRGILHRSSSSSSSSSSSEDDGMGGRRKKSVKDKIKEKLPGGRKGSQQPAATAGSAYGQQGHAATTGTAGAYGQQGYAATTGTAGAGAPHGTDGEKKGLMDKIKEKLPGHH